MAGCDSHSALRLFIVTVLLATLSGCLGAPTPYEPEDLEPVVLVPASLAGVIDERGNFRRFACAAIHGDMADASATCEQYLRRARAEPPPDRDVLDREIPDDLIIGVVLGLGWDCMRGTLDWSRTPTQQLAAAGYPISLVEVEGLSSSVRNALILHEWVQAQIERMPQGRIMLVGYSKGTTDIIEMLRLYPESRKHVVALLSVAGAVGGSPLAVDLNDDAAAKMRWVPGSECEPGDATAVASLRPAHRRARLADALPVSLRSYSIATAPEWQHVSRALRPGFRQLTRIDPMNDGALLAYDQIIPGSSLLGYANADHWAVALPVDVEGSLLNRVAADENAFPRLRLWQAAIDFVLDDLARAGEAGPGAAP
jgi:hypothetical protein